MYQPMLAERGQDKDGNILPQVSLTSTDCYYERKWEGVRAIIAVGDGVRLWSRSGRELTDKFPELQGLAEHVAMPAVLDGEIICLRDGKVHEKWVQSRVQSSRTDKIRMGVLTKPATFRVFDLLELTGHADLTVAGQAMPAIDRKKVLDELITPSPLMKVPLHSEGDGEALLHSVFADGGEGIMVKRKDGLYRPGFRSSDWYKVKGSDTESFVVCGITHGTGWRESTFGALILGKPENGHMRYSGAVGTGFDVADLQRVLDALDGGYDATCPFPEPPYEPELRSYTRPEVVIDVKFHKITSDGKPLWPVFMGLRPDLSVKDVQ